jgi:phosphomannomutase
MITASHNPKEYTGVKAVKEKALPISGSELLSIIEKNNYGL